MIVECPRCRTTYNLDESRLDPAGSKVRCIRCGNVFVASPGDAPVDEAELDDLLSDFGARRGEVLGDGRDEPGDEDEDNPSLAAVVTDRPRKVFTIEDRFDLEGQAPQSKGLLKKLAILVAVLAVLVGGLWGASRMGLLGRSGGTAAKPQEAQAPTTAERGSEAVRQISLENVRQYYVANDKAGQLFVIEGQAVNNFDSPRELIQVEANLFDEAGGVLQSKVFMCGNTVSYYELQVASREEIEKKLASQVGILANNMGLAPGASAPFMAVFPNPPEAVREFGLKVVDVRLPASK